MALLPLYLVCYTKIITHLRTLYIVILLLYHAWKDLSVDNTIIDTRIVSKSKLFFSLLPHFLCLIRRYVLSLLARFLLNFLVHSYRSRVSLRVKLHLSSSATASHLPWMSFDLLCPPSRLNVDHRVKFIPFKPTISYPSGFIKKFIPFTFHLCLRRVRDSREIRMPYSSVSGSSVALL